MAFSRQDIHKPAETPLGLRPIFLHQREKLDKEIVAPRLEFPGSTGQRPVLPPAAQDDRSAGADPSVRFPDNFHMNFPFQALLYPG
jgi:hypothetical protein